MADVFISYSRRDAAFGKRVHARLTQSNRDVWMDWEDIPPTADWWAEICEGIEKADNFLLIMSPDSIGSPVCQMEILKAIEHGKRIVPLFYRDPLIDTAFTRAADRTAEDEVVRALLGKLDAIQLCKDNWAVLGSINWVFFDHDDDFDAKFAELERIIDADLRHTKAHTRLLTRALEWEEADRAVAPLLDGNEIDQAEAWLAQAEAKLPAVTDLQREYIAASRAAHNEARRNRRRAVFAFSALAIMLVATVALATIATVLYSASVNSEAQARTAEYQAILERGLAETAVADNAFLLTKMANYVEALEQGGPPPTQYAGLAPNALSLNAGEVYGISYPVLQTGLPLRVNVEANFDTIIRVLLNGTPVARNDDDQTAPNAFDSYVQFTVQRVGEYVVQVSGFRSEAGQYVLSINGVPQTSRALVPPTPIPTATLRPSATP